MSGADRREGWVTYQAIADGVEALVSVDTSATPPRGGAPDLVRATIELGFRDDLTELRARVERLVEGLDPARDAYVGRVLRAHSCTIYVYSAEAQALGAGWRGGAVGETAESVVDPDPAWRHFWEFLYPNALGWADVDNDRLLARLEELGDDPEAPREVDHWAEFEEREHAEGFAATVRARGFAAEVRARARDGGWEVRCAREHPVARAAICEVTYKLVRLAEEFLGRYDGWGCRVTRAGEPSRGADDGSPS